jgi:hypothetical protein
MVYLEIQLDGSAKFYEIADARLLLKVAIETQAACLPMPSTMYDAHEYLRAHCYQLEIFGSVEDAEDWAESYTGFRACEVRAELARYALRRESYSPLAAVAA